MSPFVPMAEMVHGFLAAKDNPSLLRVWVNTALGEVWQERGEAPDHERLYERREPYRRGVVPARAVLLTAGVDVQRDRLEVEVVAWGRGLESWSVDYRVLHGDPAQEEVWRQLEEVLGEPLRRDGGATAGSPGLRSIPALRLIGSMTGGGVGAMCGCSWSRASTDCRRPLGGRPGSRSTPEARRSSAASRSGRSACRS